MGGIDTKSLLIGLAVGYLILPKIIVACRPRHPRLPDL
jgi:hypothetical protein